MALIPQPLIFVPLDDRRATRQSVLDLTAAAGLIVRTPDRSLLGGRDRPGDVQMLWEWVAHALRTEPPPAVCLASIEMLCFGGLVAARKSVAPWQTIVPYLDQVRALATRLPTYVSAVIPRTPVHSDGSEDPLFWETYGPILRQYMAEADALAEGAGPGDPALTDAGGRAGALLDQVPGGVIETLLRSRRRHLLINAELLIAASRGPVRGLLIGQDDTTPRGLSRMDRRVLERLAGLLEVTGALTTGADELAQRLFARWLNDTAGSAPNVRVIYSFPEASDRVPAYESTPLSQTVHEHIESAGGRVVDGDEDLLLWVHNFADERQREARDQGGEPPAQVTALLPVIREAVTEGRVVGLADVRFANGADGSLVEALLQEPLFAGISAYAGWNTSSNSLGSAVAQTVVAHHIDRDLVSGDRAAARRALVARLLDDWGYQAVVRPMLGRTLEQLGGRASALGTHAPALEAAALAAFAETVQPPIEASFGLSVRVSRVAFPWHRLFEAEITFDLRK